MKHLTLALLLATTVGTALAADSADLSDGEIRRVDKDAAKLTIKHGELKNLDMPPMTMIFDVKDKAWLDKLKAGDKVRFRAEKQGSNYVVTVVEPRSKTN
jgi:Cu/Ag efflux protein CusF